VLVAKLVQERKEFGIWMQNVLEMLTSKLTTVCQILWYVFIQMCPEVGYLVIEHDLVCKPANVHTQFAIHDLENASSERPVVLLDIDKKFV
jgi:hypothetical protein